MVSLSVVPFVHDGLPDFGARGGVIEAVGPVGSTPVPADARLIDVKGKVVHAAFIDPYVPVDRLVDPGGTFLELNEGAVVKRHYKAGEIISTTEWPCAGTMTPLNYSARQVMDFFNSRQKSRLARTPWANDQIRLDDGLSGDLPKIIAPKVAPINRDAWPDL